MKRIWIFCVKELEIRADSSLRYFKIISKNETKSSEKHLSKGRCFSYAYFSERTVITYGYFFRAFPFQG